MQNDRKIASHLSCRAFLRLAGITAAGSWLVACTAAPTGEQADASAPAAEEITVTYQMGDAELTPAEIE